MKTFEIGDEVIYYHETDKNQYFVVKVESIRDKHFAGITILSTYKITSTDSHTRVGGRLSNYSTHLFELYKKSLDVSDVLNKLSKLESIFIIDEL